MITKLRPHQTAAVDLLRDALRNGAKRPMLRLATGSGKTLTMAAICESATAKGRTVTLIAPSIELTWQTFRVFAREGLRVRALQGSRAEGPDNAPITIATIQTASKRDLPIPAVLLVDEAHLLHRDHLRMIEDVVAAGGVCVGASATPWGAKVAETFDVIVQPASMSTLVQAGFLVPLRIFDCRAPDLRGVRVRRGDFVESDLAERLNTTGEIASLVRTWFDRADDKRTLTFAVSVAHARAIAAAFRAAGIAAEAVDGSMGREERDGIFRRFRTGETAVLVNVALAIAGIDIPEIEVVQFARPTMSPALLVQALGRAMRPAPGKVDAVVLDSSGSVRRLGLPDEIDEPEVDPPVVCRACDRVYSERETHCPECATPKHLTEATMTRWLSGLRWIQSERGYGRGWAKYRFVERFGCFPTDLDAEPRRPARDIFEFISARAAAWRAERVA